LIAELNQQCNQQSSISNLQYQCLTAGARATVVPRSVARRWKTDEADDSDERREKLHKDLRCLRPNSAAVERQKLSSVTFYA